MDLQGLQNPSEPQDTPQQRGLRGRLRDKLQKRFAAANQGDSNGTGEKSTIAGLQIMTWTPTKATAPYPMVIFSHGYHGCDGQSAFIMQALADAGYLVIAPNHKDAVGQNGALMQKPEESFAKAGNWSDSTYKYRRDDIVHLLDALHKDPKWNSQIDWSKLALCGHSLGGYTVLGLGGAWPSWKIPGVKAILALSPYCTPFIDHGNLGGMGAPVMYQGGTKDFGITPFVKRPGGAFSKSASPAYFVEFSNLSHFGWTSFNKNKSQQEAINFYAVSFLDKYVKGSFQATPSTKLEGVAALEVK